MKSNSSPSRFAGVKPHFSATLRDATFSTRRLSKARLTESSRVAPLQECAQSARRQSLPTEGRRDEIRHLHRIIDWAKLDCTNRLACGHSPERKRETRTGNPLVPKPLDNVDVMRVRLR